MSAKYESKWILIKRIYELKIKHVDILLDGGLVIRKDEIEDILRKIEHLEKALNTLYPQNK